MAHTRRTPTATTWLVTLLMVVTIVTFAMSYRGLVNYAGTIGIPRWLAWAYPLMLDLPVIAAEIVLFSAVTINTSKRVRGWTWFILIGFTGLSVVANMDVLPVLAGKALPPAVLAVVLGSGLGEYRRRLSAPPATIGRARLARPSLESEPDSPVRKPTPRQPSTAFSTGRGRKLDPAAEARAVERYRELTAGGATVSVREFTKDPVCGGNRHIAGRAAKAAALNGNG
jgi:hypothetical protein